MFNNTSNNLGIFSSKNRVEFRPIYHPLSDSDGLTRAYKTGEGLYLDKNSKTLYIAGTKDARDVLDDMALPFTETPLIGNNIRSHRYNSAKRVLDENRDIKYVVGHSLGSAVATQLVDDMKGRDLKANEYSTPSSSTLFDPMIMDIANYYSPQSHKNKNIRRYKNISDPIAVGGSEGVQIFGDYIHGYQQLAGNRKVSKDFGFRNQDVWKIRDSNNGFKLNNGSFTLTS